MKRILALALALALCLGLTVPALAVESPKQYTDVAASHWAYDAIQDCTAKGWFEGYAAGDFRPDNQIRRDEAAKVFAVAAGLDVPERVTVTYLDISGNWGKNFIEAAKDLFPDPVTLEKTSVFRPEQSITREETIYALMIAWRFGSQVNDVDVSLLDRFADVDQISAGVKPYLAVAVREGLVSGLPGNLIGPKNGLTRAEFVTLLSRATSYGLGPDSAAAPQIALDRYSDTTAEEQVTLTGKVSPMVAGTTLTVEGREVALSADGSFSASLTLSAGTNSFVFRANSPSRAVGSKTVSLTRSPEAVSVRVLSNVPQETQEESLTVSGAVHNYAAGCSLTCNGQPVAVDGSGQFSAQVSLAEGANVLSFAVQRGAEEVAVATVRVNRVVPEPGDALLTSCALSIAHQELLVGEATSVRAVGTYSNGATRDITAQCGLTASDPAVLTVGSDGAVVALAEGTSQITVTGLPAGVTAPGPLTVSTYVGGEDGVLYLMEAEWVNTGAYMSAKVLMDTGSVQTTTITRLNSDKDLAAEDASKLTPGFYTFVRDGFAYGLSSVRAAQNAAGSNISGWQDPVEIPAQAGGVSAGASFLAGNSELAAGANTIFCLDQGSACYIQVGYSSLPAISAERLRGGWAITREGESTCAYVLLKY